MHAFFVWALLAAPPPAEPVRYTLRFPAPHTHVVEVEADVPTAGRPEVVLMMAVWTPGSYLVREYARHVEGVTGGRGVAKVAKNRWRVDTGGADRVTVRYRVYGREMSVRTNWIEDRFALINGAPTFLAPVDGLSRPYEVKVESPWPTVVSALSKKSAKSNTYLAPSYDALVDAPFYAGTPDVRRFTVDGREHLLVTEGAAGLWDLDRAAADLGKVVDENRKLWGGLPYQRYVFLNLLTETSGGLEHAESTVLMGSRWDFRSRDAYVDWLRLASHEHFHAWNVKRLRPVELGPFDYEREVYTPSLWIAEGLTAYYESVVLRRAGLIDDAELLKAFTKRIETHQDTPGRFVRSLEEASYDAWIKHYRPDENSINSTVSYYNKGALVGLVLDAALRERGRSLDEVMRLAWGRHSGAKGYTAAELRAAIDEVAPSRELVEALVAGTGEIDFAPVLRAYGLAFKTPAPRVRPGEAGEPDRGWLGFDLKDTNNVVERVRRNTPAHAAGVDAEDEVIALDDFRVAPGTWKDRRAQYPPGTQATLLVARRQRLVRLPVTFAAEPPERWKLELDAKATPDQLKRRQSWLTGAPP